MKLSLKKKLALCVCTVLLTCLTACSIIPGGYSSAAEEEPHGPYDIRVWYVAKDRNQPDYSLFASTQDTEEYHVLFTSFDSVASLAAAFDDEIPELVFCDYHTALAFCTHNNLAGLGQNASAVPGCNCTDSEGICGKAFFPLAARGDVLLVNTALYEENNGCAPDAETLSTAEGILALTENYTDEGGASFFAADSYTRFFRAYMHQKGYTFTGDRLSDIKSEDYVSLYNMFAEAAMCGYVVPGSGNCAGDVRSGGLMFCIAPSRSAEKLSGKFMVFPPPCADGGKPAAAGDAWGIAVTAQDETLLPICAKIIAEMTGNTRAFAECAADGYIPLYCADGTECDGSLTTALMTMGREYTIVIDDTDGDSFDASFNTAIGILNRTNQPAEQS